MSVPYVRLTVEGMTHSIILRLSEYEAERDAQIRAAVEAACTPENLARVVADAVRVALDKVVRDEVDQFFRYGAGRKVVREAVIARLDPDRPVDG